ncbi:MFS general substrate transporter [Phanerochaete sordida]|uniref:MFS general substrate transporter n=1 Tax=Phanerochaete sordida TaxID=48140 RepID=A0A9P3GB94_9APHY|nr:MFS general substrate transporter [Phanerochaete sordida]
MSGLEESLPRPLSVHSDDEKTVRGEPVDDALRRKKDEEDGVNSEEQVETHEEAVASSVDPNSGFPEGGSKAWLIVFGAALGNASTFGYVNAWGIFQTYYQQTLLSHTSPSTIAWIGSIQYALTFMPGLFVGQLFDRGYLKGPLFASSIGLVVSTLLVAQCTTYWQFLLCQGFAVGLFSGLTFGPLVAVVAHWFRRRKGLALGCLAFGSSTGGVIFPIVVHNLIDSVGFKWTMRVVALILLCFLTVTFFTVERRLPPKPDPGPLINVREFRSLTYSVYCLSGFVTFLGLYTMLTYINVSAEFVGIDAGFAVYLVSIGNAGSAAGRVVAGLLADRWGPLNIMIPATLFAGITTYIWPFIHTKASYIVLGIINGIFTGVYASMLTAPLLGMGQTETVGLRVGMFFSILALGALAGPPISGAINDATGYKEVGYYAGSSILCAVICLIVARHLILRRLWGKA